jgi:CRP/FNR family transcriptional regulator
MNTLCAACGNRSECFNELSINELSRVAENKAEISFKKGETLIKQNAAAKHIYFVKSGLVKVQVEHQDKSLILEIAGKSSMLGITSLNYSKHYNFSVTAIGPVEACEIDIEVIKSIMTNNVGFSTNIIRELNQTIGKLLTKVYCLSQKNIHARMADLLVNFADVVFKSKTFVIPMSRTELAELSNMAKENVVRILKEFDNKGLIKLSGKSIEILDYNALLKLRD